MEGPLRVQDLTSEQLSAFRKKFDAIDLNKDGVIELREMAAISRVFGYRLSLDELRVSQGPVPRADQTRRREHFGRPSRG